MMAEYEDNKSERIEGNFEDGISLPDTYPAMPVIDYDYYLTFLAESDAPIEEKYKLIETLFNIMMGFADIAFGLSPTQNVCGKAPTSLIQGAFEASNQVQCELKKLNKEFADKAAAPEKGEHT